MKPNSFLRSLSLFLAFALCFSVVTAAPPAARAAEPAETIQISLDDICSPWAYFDIFVAQNAYAIGNEETYTNFRGALTAEKFAAVCLDLAAVNSSAYQFTSKSDPVTRGQVISALFEIITGYSPIGAMEAIDYFVREKMIGGRGGDGYQEDEPCTVEEMLIFAGRAYEQLVYQTGRDSKGFFWEVQGKSNTVYLLGSIHLSDGSLYPLSRAIESAFAGTKNLVLEIVDIDDSSGEIAAYIFEYGFIDPASGKTIRDYISEETYALFAQACSSFGFLKEQYDYMYPWLATLLLQSIILTGGDPDTEQMQKNAFLGMDMYYLAKARLAGKNILELENAAFQLDMMSSYSPELQEYQLRMLLEPQEDEDGVAATPEEKAESLNEAFLYLLDVVKVGDEEALGEILGLYEETDNPMLIELNEKLFTNRNYGMAEKIEGLLNADTNYGNYFIIVGAGHMLGDTGVVTLLTERGYTVTRRK